MKSRARHLTRLAAGVVSAGLSLTCSVSSLIPGTGAQSSGPMVAMLSAAALDEGGHIRDPKSTFAPTDPQITVAVLIDPASDIVDQPLRLTWYQVTPDGDVELFTDTVEVSSGEAAYTTGGNPGTLSAGTYRVAASLGESALDSYFHVIGPQAAGQAPSDPSSVAQAAGTGPPVQKEAGIRVTIVNDDSFDSDQAGGCELSLSSAQGSVVYPSNMVIISLYAYGCAAGEVKLHAGVNGALGPLTTVHLEDSHAIKLGGQWTIDPCAIPGRSDLQGDQVFITAEGLGPLSGLSTELHLTLGADDAPPVLNVNWDPPGGARIDKDEKVTIQISARDPQPGGPWQTGVRNIRVQRDGQLLDDHRFGEQAGKCGAKIKSVRPYQHVYTSRERTPLSFQLCVLAFDHANEPATNCRTYYRGDHWRAVIDSTGSGIWSVGSCVDEKWTTVVDMVLDDDGNVEGTARSSIVAAPQCTAFAGPSPNPASRATANIVGTFDESTDTFSIQLQQTSIDGATDGLLNYSLWLGEIDGKGPKLQFEALGSTEIPVTVDVGAGTVTATAVHKIYNVQCVNCRQ